MTRKDHIAIAKAIKAQREHAVAKQELTLDRLSEDLCGYLSDDNPAFDSARFLKACGVN